MRYFTSFSAILFFFLVSTFSKAQMAGTYSVPGTFSSLAVAINSLNMVGVSGPVTINIQGNYTETVTTGGYSLYPVAGSSTINTITFRKDGSGYEPTFIAYTGTKYPYEAAQDGLWRFIGADNICLDSLSFIDYNFTPVWGGTSLMEFGLGFFKYSPFDGCQNNQIRNCKISLSQKNNDYSPRVGMEGSRGIEFVNAAVSSHTAIASILSAAGAHSNNSIRTSTVENCNYGISFNAIYDYTTTPSFFDSNNSVGGATGSDGNQIINFGAGVLNPTPSSGIYFAGQLNWSAKNNFIDATNGSTGTRTVSASLSGIYGQGNNRNMAISDNTISLKVFGSSGEGLYGVYLTGNSNLVNSLAKTEINRNYFTGFSSLTNYYSRPYFGIYNGTDTDTLFITGNTFTQTSVANSSTGTLSIISNIANVSSSVSISNNTLSLAYYAAGGGRATKLLSSSTGTLSPPAVTIDNNLFTNLNLGTSIPNDNYDFIYAAGSNASLSVSGNTFMAYTGAGVSTISLINNASTTKSLVLINANSTSAFTSSITTNSLTCYNGQNANGFGSTVIVSNNSFNMGQALMSFTGIKTREGNFLNGYSRKLIFNNLITNIRSGGFTGIEATMMGDALGTAASAIYNNTISSVFASGYLYGITTASLTDAVLPLEIYGNTVQQFTYTSGSGGGNAIGMSLEAGTNGLNLYRNKIAGIVATNTTFPNGLSVSTGTTTECTVKIYNNILGNFSGTNSATFSGISVMSLSGSCYYKVYYNTLYSAPNNTIFGRALTISALRPADVRNNIIINNNVNTGFFGAKSGAINTSAATHSISSNNNCFYSRCLGSDGLAATTNSVYANMADLRNFLANTEQNSFTENVSFTSTSFTDAAYLTPSSTVATQIESGAMPISWITTDFYGNPRNSTTPDVGAIEGNYLPLLINDSLPPSLPNYGFTNLVCNATGRTFTAQIQDVSGVGTGSLAPRLYYKLNAGTYSSTAGSLSAGTASAGTWSFTLNYTASYNDVVSWFLVAQDASTLTNITSYPPTSLTAVSVNSIVTTPIAATYTVIMPLGGTYSVGAGGAFTSLTSAANAYNSACLTGPVTFVLTDANYGAGTETFPITFRKNPDASATNSLLILPANSSTVSISGSTLASIPAVIKFLDAHYITLDGNKLNGGRLNLLCASIANTNIAVAWLASSNGNGSGTGNRFIKFKHLEIGSTGNTLGYYSTYGIIACANYSNLSQYYAGGKDNDDISIEGNTFLALTEGIFAVGSQTNFPAYTLSNWTVNNNVFGPVSSSTVNTVNRSIYFERTNQLSVSNNTLTNALGHPYIPSVVGVELSTGVTDATVAANVVRSFTANIAGSSSGAVQGIIVDSKVANNKVLICNNLISDLVCLSNDYIYYSGILLGSSYNQSGGTKVLNNTIALRMGSAYSTTIQTQSACLSLYAQINTEVKNNIFYTDNFNSGNSASKSFCIYNTSWISTSLTVNDNNAYYGAAPLTQNPLISSTFITNTVSTLAALQATTGQNMNSMQIQPVFVSVADAHLDATAPVNSMLDNTGAGITLYSTDVDNQARNVSAPDIGADEFTSTGTCTSAIAGTVSPASYSICSTQSINILSNNSSYGAGTSFEWQVSPTSGGTFSVLNQGSGLNSPNYITSGSLSPGIYYLRLKAACASNSAVANSNEVMLTVTGLTQLSVTASQSVACSGGSVALTANGATSYTWSTGANTASIVVSPSMSSTYFVTGQNGSCAVATSSNFVLYTSPNPTISTAAVNTLICAGVAATLSASGASTYSWSNGVGGATINPTPAITTVYTVTGYNTLGCLGISSRTIFVNASPTIGITGSSSVCAGQTLSLLGSGGLTYTWSTGTVASSITVSPLSTSVYTLYGKNSLGCVSQKEFTVTTTTPAALVVTGSLSICATQTTNLIASGYTNYNWSTGATAASVALSPNISTTYTVTGSSGTCTNAALVQLTVNALPTLSISGIMSVCAGQSATVTASGASTYSWSDGSGSAVRFFTATTNTVYFVTGTNANGCSLTNSVSIISNTVPVISITQSTATVCAANPVTFTASGAISYTWSSGVNTAVITVTPSGSSVYTVYATNAAGCEANTTVTVLVNQSPTISVVPPSYTVCAQTPISYTASGATSYSWSNGGGNNATVSYTPFTPGTYTVNAGHSLNTCIASQTVAVITNSLPVITVFGSSTLCAGETTTLLATGAANYLWNTTATTPFIVVSPVANTNFLVIGSASNGCSSSTGFAITTYSMPVINITSSASSVCIGAAATLTASGAANYTWTGTGVTTATQQVNPVSPTIYTVTGSSGASCISSTTITISTYVLPVLSVSPPTNSVCVGSPVSFTASAASTYTWSNSGGNSATVTYTPQSNSVYTVSTSDLSTGCVNSKTVSVFTNSLPIISISGGTAMCSGQTLTLTAGGASSYSWSAGIQNSTISVSQASIYVVSGNNSAGCNSSASVSIITYTLPVISIAQSTTSVCPGSPVSFTASGASTYSWINNGATSATEIFYPTSTGNYTVLGYSSELCMATKTAAINTFSLPLVTLSPSSVSVCANSVVFFTASGANTYSWSTGSANSSISVSPSAASVYTVVGTDVNSCSSSASASVHILPSPVLGVSGSTAVCIGNSTTLTAGGANTYTWQSSVVSPSILANPVTTTIYSLSGSVGNCTASLNHTVIVNPLPVVQAIASSTAVCSGSTLVLSGSGANIYSWTDNIINGVGFIPSSSSSYSVNGIDANGCSGSSSVFVQVLALPSLTVTSADTLVCEGAEFSVNVDGALTYTWSNGATGSGASYTLSVVNSTLTVSGTDVKGCITSSSFVQTVEACTGVQMFNAGLVNIDVYPNPFATQFTIASSGYGKNFKIEVLNYLGQIVKRDYLQQSSQTILMEEFARGLYIVRVMDSNKVILEKKIIKN